MNKKRNTKSNSRSRSVGVSITKGETSRRGSSTITKTIGRGRSVTVIEREIDPRDIEDMLRGKRHFPRPPVRITYYKPTRAQHYHAIGRIYGVVRKPGQSLPAYAREVDEAVAAAFTRQGLRP